MNLYNVFLEVEAIVISSDVIVSVASNLIKINQGKKEENNQWQTRFSHIFICPILRRAALIKFTWKRWCLCFKLQNIPSGSLSERERKSSRNLCPAVANSCGSKGLWTAGCIQSWKMVCSNVLGLSSNASAIS